MIHKLREKVKRSVQAYSASVAITLAQLGYSGPDDAARPKVAIERVQPALPFGVFDPREVVAHRIILTIPISERRAAGDQPRYFPN